jgi:hypothetical protein
VECGRQGASMAAAGVEWSGRQCTSMAAGVEWSENGKGKHVLGSGDDSAHHHHHPITITGTTTTTHNTTHKHVRAHRAHRLITPANS